MTDPIPSRVAERMVVYKALDPRGRSTHQKFPWPKPQGKRPGKWVEIEGRPHLCVRGLHGWLTLDIARQWSEGDIYEMEIEGDIVSDDQKAAGRRGRLLRVVEAPAFGEILDWGLWPCEKCGKQHAYRRIGQRRVTWADPDDGHSYYHLDSSRTVVVKLMAALGYTPETMDWAKVLA